MKNCTNTLGWKLGKLKSLAHTRDEKLIRINEYNKSPTRCLKCQTPFNYENRHKKFCNRSCSASYNNVGVSRKESIINTCVCGNTIKGKNKKYCSIACFNNNKNTKNIQHWKNNQDEIKILPSYVRNYLLEKSGNKCCECDWGEKNPYSGHYALVIDHIDGNSENNREDNLRVLCARCDSMTATYMGLNRGKGRVVRRQTYERLKLKATREGITYRPN